MSEEQTKNNQNVEDTGKGLTGRVEEDNVSTHSRIPAAQAKSSPKGSNLASKQNSVTSNKAKLASNKSPSIVIKYGTTVEQNNDATLRKATIPAQLSEITAVQPNQPIPPILEAVAPQNDTVLDEQSAQGENSKDKITELRTLPKVLDWSDEEEAGGLPRTESRESRISRVSRAVRQLFCCGVPYESQEEDNVSYQRSYAI